MRCWHRLVAADDLRIAQASFYEPGDSLAPQIVKAEILKARCLIGIGPRFVERVGASYGILAGCTEEREFGVGRAQGLASDSVNTRTETWPDHNFRKIPRCGACTAKSSNGLN